MNGLIRASRKWKKRHKIDGELRIAENMGRQRHETHDGHPWCQGTAGTWDEMGKGRENDMWPVAGPCQTLALLTTTGRSSSLRIYAASSTLHQLEGHPLKVVRQIADLDYSTAARCSHTSPKK
jgi:hypothetical protein